MSKQNEAQHDLNGMALLQHPRYNKATAFTEAERERYGLHGLLPPAVYSRDNQVQRVMENLSRKASDIERYVFLMALQARNERLFYQVALEHIDAILPLIYTPTVGQACKEFAHVFRQPQGMYICAKHRGRFREVLDNWPEQEVSVVVVTDGERILGLGDLGANGMGIPIGKLALYTTCAGIDPCRCMPVMLDVGTNNEELLDDPLYLGTRSRRLEGEAYDEFVQEFIQAVADAFPGAVIQFEDFATPNAVALLDGYRDRVRCFNDDIQGTAAVVLAGIYAANRITGLDFRDLRILFLGAGSANTGIADLVTEALVDAGLDENTARQRLWLVDLEGLVTADRDDLPSHQKAYAQARDPMDFVEALRVHQPQFLIGATGAPGSFTEAAVKAMAEINDRPAIFALSNPTDRAECTAEQAYEWTDGKAIFASGSPFDPVEYQGETRVPGQSNNVYIFPGVGLGALAGGADHITSEMFLVAARALAEAVQDARLQQGAVYPELGRIRELSRAVALAVGGLVWEGSETHLAGVIDGMMYDPMY